MQIQGYQKRIFWRAFRRSKSFLVAISRHLGDRRVIRFGVLLASGCLGIITSRASEVTLLRTPDGGIQPQATVDDKGVLHLIYFQGEARAGNIFYVRKQSDSEKFSKPIHVNHRAGSAIAIGTIRGAQFALGRAGRIHVVWNGTATASNHVGAPLFYTRSNEAGTAFENERDMITFAAGLDGGSSVAADPKGNVYVTWHARAPDAPEGEAGRAVFVARSTDDGTKFAHERRATQEPTGACGCCGMRSSAGTDGSLYVLYRGASEKINRNEILLVSQNQGEDFEVAFEHPWKIGSCPMSSAWLASAKTGMLAAWETDGQVYLAPVQGKKIAVSKPITPSGAGKRKHPVAVANSNGEILLAWTEGTGWQKGGAVAWQRFDALGKALGEQGRSEGVPVWSLAAAYAKPDGNFVIVY